MSLETRIATDIPPIQVVKACSHVCQDKNRVLLDIFHHRFTRKPAQISWFGARVRRHARESYFAARDAIGPRV
jgi:hypothetical protein